MHIKNIGRLKPGLSTEGSVLIIALIFCAIMGITMASYLTLSRAQQLSIVRSQWWNASMAVTEAGIEDGMAHINTPTAVVDKIFDSDGYTLQADGTYSVTRQMTNGYYTVTISVPYVGFPLVTSVGYAKLPPYYSMVSGPMFAAAGVNVPTYEARTVQVTTKLDALFNVAMAAKGKIDFKGNNVSTDSFDSASTNYSAWTTNGFGLYSSAYDKGGGDVVTDSNITNSLSVGNAKIKGVIRTGPTGSPYMGPNGSVGDAAWVDGGNSGIEAGHYYNDMNVVWPDVVKPNVTWIVPPQNNVSINGVTYSYYLTQGNYQINDFNGSVYVAGGEVNIYVPPTGRVNQTGNNQIYIAPVTGNDVSTNYLHLYVACPTAKLSGNGVMNQTGMAIGFVYYGLPSNTSLSLNANSAFVGAIYCPEADFSLGGGGGNTYDFIGSSVSSTIVMNGSFNFHYDENLRRIGPGRGFIATGWREVATH
jgi:hypothetical protein